MTEGYHFEECKYSCYQACLCILNCGWLTSGAYFQTQTVVFFMITEPSSVPSLCRYFELIGQGSSALSVTIAGKARQDLI